jgi:Mg-chelatase subunit ChlI
VFDASLVEEIANRHRSVLLTLDEIRKELESRFEGMADPILALILAVASGEALLLVGPPGTGKSLLIKSFCKMIGVSEYFEYLLTPFTEPGELWGFYDLAKLAEKKGLERMNVDHMMQSAKIVFLDEIFKGSSAILNSLLTFMNEHKFYDRGEPRDVKLQCLFAATNELPEASELRAVQDRFILRCRVDNAGGTHNELKALFTKSWPLTYSSRDGAGRYRGLLDDLARMRTDIQENAAALFQPDDIVARYLAQAVTEARHYGLSEMSNRRLTKFLYVMLIHRMYNATRGGRRVAEEYPWQTEVHLLFKFFLDRQNEEITARLAGAARGGVAR